MPGRLRGLASSPEQHYPGRVPGPRSTIVCVDCGGRCHLLGYPPEDDAWEVGDIVAYRCEDCHDRWDLELTDDDLEEDHDE
jgi:hypothetical protein